ncbi:MAG: YdbC family protein [Candidatus Weimeria sp.]
MADKDSFTFDIKASVGTISQSSRGWTKELNLVSWNGREAKYDIREWSPDHEKLGKGVTLSEEELRTLGKLIDQEIKRLDRGVSDAVDYDEL